MPVALIAKDKPDRLSVRMETRPDRVAYLKSHDSVEQAETILDDAGAMCGSLIVSNAADMAEAEAFVEGDPYGKVGLFDRVDPVSWNRGSADEILDFQIRTLDLELGSAGRQRRGRRGMGWRAKLSGAKLHA